ncbi:MAG: aminotransferase class V-fold PLP-dependent enzyme [Phycisphaerales bacterium]|nr:aminotransferase class V-fold PLP-dependent enzyme [Phycisphaerales bacterium]
MGAAQDAVSQFSPALSSQARSFSRLTRDLDYLNHGSFGACPDAVLDHQGMLRDRMEREAVKFFVYDLEPLLDEAMSALGGMLDADPQDLAPVTNATVGVNSVLRSLEFAPGDELLTTNHEYNACCNVLQFVAKRGGARVVVADVPFPVRDEAQVVDAILARVTKRTRLAMISHITSPTAIVFPIKRIVHALAARGIDTLVDAAHAPGMVDVSIRDINPAYYTGNCHKWLCAPKGAGFLYVRRDLQKQIRPAVISHGANSKRTDRSRYRIEFFWTGTSDPTPVLCVPKAIETMAGLLPGGWAALRDANRALARSGRDCLCAALGVTPPVPDAMLGSMASIPLPAAPPGAPPPTSSLYADPLQNRLIDRHRVQVPIVPWPQPPERLVRISAQVYNSPPQYDRLSQTLIRALADEARP